MWFSVMNGKANKNWNVVNSLNLGNDGQDMN